MVNENVNILLKLPWMEEREYMDMAEKITSELIERFDSSEKDAFHDHERIYSAGWRKAAIL